jgi:cardiolipin synthase
MEWLEEGCLVVDDRAFAQEFEQRWQEDMARSVQMTRRPSHERAPPLASSEVQYQSQQ